MGRGIDSFVILADMRTGSNALEDQLNAVAGISCHGELFNPNFMGRAGSQRLFGIDLAARDGDPKGVLDLMKRETQGLPGFRLFSDHDRRVAELCLKDRSCAKIVLTRNPIDSYVSLKIARKTGQWWLGDLRSAKAGKARFDADEFERYLAAQSEWHTLIRRRLQTSGQAAFEFRYEDIRDPEVVAGLIRFLGLKPDAADRPMRQGRVQNPMPLSEKVVNFAEMRAALQDRDLFDLDVLPNHEPARGPNVPGFLASSKYPLLYMPIKCAAETRVANWLSALDGTSAEQLESGFTRKSLRQWKRRQGPHTSFTVVMHPLARAHDAFCRFILPTSPEGFSGIRRQLIQSYKVPLPDDPDDPSYDIDTHREAFLRFLGFLKGNLGGQTSVRVDAAWASQEVLVRGLADFGMPDAILREAALEHEFQALATRVGAVAPREPDPPSKPRHSLADIYDTKLERAARAAYQRDYMMFGFEAWR